MASSRPAHRPTKLTPGMQTAICEAIEQTGCSDSAAAAVSGVDPASITRWKARAEIGEEPYASFINALKHARAQAEHNLLKKMQERGEAQQDWREIAWRLERGWKEHWGKTDKHEVSGPDGEALKVYVSWSPEDEV